MASNKATTCLCVRIVLEIWSMVVIIMSPDNGLSLGISIPLILLYLNSPVWISILTLDKYSDDVKSW